MKKNIFYLLSVLSIFNANASMTISDVNNNLGVVKNEYSPPDSEREQRWRDYALRPSESSTVLKVTTSTYSARNGTKRLKPVNGYICTASRAYGYYHRGLKGIDVSVYQSGGYWYLKAASPNSDNIGEATCWNTK